MDLSICACPLEKSLCASLLWTVDFCSANDRSNFVRGVQKNALAGFQSMLHVILSQTVAAAGAGASLAEQAACLLRDFGFYVSVGMMRDSNV